MFHRPLLCSLLSGILLAAPACSSDDPAPAEAGNGTEAPSLPDLSPLTTFDPLNMTLWENYPKGLYEMLMLVETEFGLPSIVTENGTDKVTDDAYASDALVRTLTWVHQAIEEGADVGGYFYWSLIDNYEWNHGLSLRFGLFEVDVDDVAKPRTARGLAPIYAGISQQNAISAAQQEMWPIAP
ncbi:MAG: beta-glucosidase/6-phospho-beta-glucosidase/beta-galactosidase [Myxococcota bacterium]|jgi:beta-glucosidase/6-phospho-beta-glucosidase/beta-galactosidase